RPDVATAIVRHEECLEGVRVVEVQVDDDDAAAYESRDATEDRVGLGVGQVVYAIHEHGLVEAFRVGERLEGSNLEAAPGAFPTPARKRDGVRAQVEAQIVARDGETEAARAAREVEHALARGGPERGPHLAERPVAVADEPTVVEEGTPEQRAER